VDAAAFFGLDASFNNILAPGIVMGIMIIPFISSLSDDVINSIPQSLREGAFALGTTRSETIRKVVLPAAMPGVISAALLGVSRALGETMIVVMAAGVRPNLTWNPLEDMTTVTVNIVYSLTGDQAFDSPLTLSAFALGLVLFIVTLVLNLISTILVRRFKQKYD
jgi:phosphate transport system permease protein